MRHIVVTKLGNEPNIFGRTLREGMIGDWETRKLIKVLSMDKENFVTYYGKAIWDQDKAKEYFGKNVRFLESSQYDTPDNIIESIGEINEFHVILGPHSFYNGGKNIPAWESIKKSIVTERLLNRVAPQIKLMNKCKNANRFFYLSDRRFLLQAADLEGNDGCIYAQSIKEDYYYRYYFTSNDYTYVTKFSYDIKPFRFETLWFLEKSKIDMYKNYTMNKYLRLAIPANQVTSDEEISKSRISKILEFTDYFKNYSVIGKWTQDTACGHIKRGSHLEQYLNGLDLNAYYNKLKEYKYALVLFNTADGPECFKDNWITVKFWECVYNGCITFVERGNKELPFIPKELQVKDGIELRDKIDRCESDIHYKEQLIRLQQNLVKDSYFDGSYFTDFINNERTN